MDFAQLFVGFLQPVIIGSVAVFLLLALVALRSPHRSPVAIGRKPRR